eukprot:UN30158
MASSTKDNTINSLNQDINELNEDVTDLTTDKTLLTRDVQTCQTENTTKDNTINGLNQNVTDLTDDLTDCQNESTTKDNEISTVTAQRDACVNSLTQDQTSTNAQINTLISERDTCENEKTTVEGQRDTCETEKTGVQNNLDSATANLNTCNNNLASCEAGNATCTDVQNDLNTCNDERAQCINYLTACQIASTDITAWQNAVTTGGLNCSFVPTNVCTQVSRCVMGGNGCQNGADTRVEGTIVDETGNPTSATNVYVNGDFVVVLGTRFGPHNVPYGDSVTVTVDKMAGYADCTVNSSNTAAVMIICPRQTGTNCVATISDCTTMCETSSQRVLTIITPQSGGGAACPTPTACVFGHR